MLQLAPAITDAGAGILDTSAQLRGRFHFWRDGTGRRLVFSVFPISAAPAYSDVVAMAVRIVGPRREVLWIGEICDTDDLASSSGIQMAIAQGASELHLHLIAGSRGQRRALLDALTAPIRSPVRNATPWRQRYAA